MCNVHECVIYKTKYGIVFICCCFVDMARKRNTFRKCLSYDKFLCEAFDVVFENLIFIFF